MIAVYRFIPLNIILENTFLLYVYHIYLHMANIFVFNIFPLQLSFLLVKMFSKLLSLQLLAMLS